MKRCTLGIILFIVIDLHAQILFENSYTENGVELGNDIKPTLDNGYIITGIANPTKTIEGQELTLIKLDSVGEVKWVRNIGDISIDKGFCVVETIDSGYVAAGLTWNFETSSDDIIMVKFNKDGGLIWQQIHEDTLTESGNDIIEVESDSGFVIVGFRENWMYLMRTNKFGDTLWTKTLPDTGVLNSINPLLDGNYLVTGLHYGYIDGILSKRGYVSKINPDGTLIWEKHFYGDGFEESFDGIELETGDIMLAGGTLKDIVPPYTNAIIRMLNSEGDLLWYKTSGGTRSDYLNSLCKGGSDRVVATGTTQRLSGDNSHAQLYLVKMDFYGIFIWEKNIGFEHPSSESGYSVCQAKDGGYVAVGNKTKDETSLFVVKFDEFGNTLFIKEIEQKASFNLYPNPMKEYTTLSFSEPISKNTTINIFSLGGQLIETIDLSNGSSSIIIQKNNLLSGIYIVQVNFEAYTVIKKLIIN